jgi:hypothetical protein
VTETVYSPSSIKKRNRATKAEMETRAEFLISYAEAHGPVTVRQLYYQAEVAGLPGIDKTDAGYGRVMRSVRDLRRGGRLDYDHIADATRWMRKPKSYDSVQDAIEATARFYRKNLWTDADTYCEIWCEKDALAGAIYPITSKYDVPLMVTRGFASETFAYESVQAWDSDKSTCVYYLGDHDRAGHDAARSLEEKLTRFADEDGIEVIFELIAVTEEQIATLGLPTRSPKRQSSADKAWAHDAACELDAIPPDTLRDMIEAAINEHLDQTALEVLKVAEDSERQILKAFARQYEENPAIT